MNWVDYIFVPVSLIYFLDILALFVYGLNFFYMSWLSLQNRSALQAARPLQGGPLPSVTIQLPIYNEWYVARRLIESIARMEYPRDLLEIQVLDDSTDETKDLVAGVVAEVKKSGVNIHHLHRTERIGYKAGALAEGLEKAHGDFIAIFDADFVPAPNFLYQALPFFDSENVAFVQARWGHLNPKHSLLTFAQSLSIDGHFVIEQMARSSAGYWFNFNGTAGVWRKRAILDAGGWQAGTLTEDLDLSYRAFLKGWEARFAGSIEARAELPVSFAAYRRQQHRWASGSMACAIKFLPMILASAHPFRKKLQAVLHLAGYAVHIFLFLLVLLYPLILVISLQYPAIVSLFGIALFFNFTALAPTVYFAVAQRSLGRNWQMLLPAILFTSILGSGMMINTVRAFLKALAPAREPVFERTPKYGVTDIHKKWTAGRYWVNLDRIVFAELLFAGVSIWTAVTAFKLKNWPIMVYSIIYGCGLLFVPLATIAQAATQAIKANTLRIGDTL